MDIQWIPVDFMALTTAQQDTLFQTWCRLVMSCLKNYNAGGVLKYEDKGDVGPATSKVIQGAQVWIDVNGKELTYNLLVAFNDMCADTPINPSSTTLRNDPNWYAGDLVSRAKDKELFPPPAETYGLLPRPTTPDIQV